MFRPSRAKSKAKAQRVSVSRFAVTLVALLAFTFQSFVAQIHIHPAPTMAATTLDAGKIAQPGKLPANDDQSNCPICQALLHAGQFITPSAVTFELPALAIYFVAHAIAVTRASQAASHNWQSRAPPRI